MFPINELAQATLRAMLNILKITNFADVDKLVCAGRRKLNRECLLAIYLNSRNKVIDIEVLAIGTLSEVLVHPREVIKSAILANAPALEGGIHSSWFTITHQATSNPPKKTTK